MNPQDKNPATIDWSDIEANLHNLVKADGGFSTAHRGIVTLPDGTQVFVKIGTDDNTRTWAKKEIAVYRFLEHQGYPFIPRLLAVSPDETSFALEVLVDGWDWSEQWDKERLDKTLEAMDALAAVIPTDADRAFFNQAVIDQSDNGWRPLSGSEKRQRVLLTKLHEAGYGTIADSLDFAEMTEQSERYTFKDDKFVHNDIRADNAAWNENTGEVKLVDWNWMQLGDRRTDLAATLTHVQKSGLDVLPDYASRLDADALHWMAGFWFHSAIKPIWPGGPAHLREHQLKAGVKALELSQQVEGDLASKLAAFGISSNNSVVIGSGILNALGLRQSSDMDVTVSEEMYEKLKANARFKETQTHGRNVLTFENLEIGTSWGVLGKDQRLDDLMKQSIVIEDVRYVSLDFLLAVKKSWLQDKHVRQKDVDDVKLIEEYKASSREDITIEKAKSQDAEAVAELLRQTWLATYPNKELGITEADILLRTDGEHGERIAKNIENWRKNIELSNGKSAAHVARKNGKVVGFSYGVIDSEGQHRIGALYVLPKVQGRGVGARLMQANLAWHGEDVPIYLAVAAYNQNAINFYKKFGFVETGKKIEDLPARRRGLKELPEIEMMRP